MSSEKPLYLQTSGGRKPSAGIFHSQDIPKEPGVYVYRDESGEVIYVGKARNLRNRMRSYFMPSTAQRSDPRRRALIHCIASYEYFTVATEQEALLLETQFIKEYSPKYNVLMRDDKRFLYVTVDMTVAYPRFEFCRIRRDDGRMYFGPFPQATALRDVIRFLEIRYRLRSCETCFPDAETHRHCLEEVIRSCSAPCVGRISQEEYMKQINVALSVLRGEESSHELISELRDKMGELAAELQFEEAAHYRDMLDALKAILEPARRFVNQTIASRRSMADNTSGMTALAAALGLEDLPRHIECFDMANISGTLAVGSMVCFRNGRPATAEYRRYKIKNPESHDDTAFMREVLTRRYTRLMTEGAPLPDLIVLDGGKPQVNMALDCFEAIHLPIIPFIGLAERYEQIIVPGMDAPLELPRDNPGLLLLQSIRDEAHRWANGYHRELRNRRIQSSVLSEIPGIGEKRRNELLRTFGSVKRILSHSPEELARKVPGLGVETAKRVLETLKRLNP